MENNFIFFHSFYIPFLFIFIFPFYTFFFCGNEKEKEEKEKEIRFASICTKNNDED